MKIGKRTPSSMSFTDDIEVGAISKDGRNGTTCDYECNNGGETTESWHWLKFNNRQTVWNCLPGNPATNCLGWFRVFVEITPGTLLRLFGPFILNYNTTNRSFGLDWLKKRFRRNLLLKLFLAIFILKLSQRSFYLRTFPYKSRFFSKFRVWQNIK